MFHRMVLDVAAASGFVIFLCGAAMAADAQKIPALPDGGSPGHRQVTVSCSSTEPSALPCSDEARRECKTNPTFVTIVSSTEMPVTPMGMGRNSSWNYQARYSCDSP